MSNSEYSYTTSKQSINNLSQVSFWVNSLPVCLLIAVTALDFLSHIALGGDYSNRAADSNLWRSNHQITNAVFYTIGLWSLAKLILQPKTLKFVLNPILILFLGYVAVVALSLIYLWPFKLPGWDTSQTYPTTMVLRLFAFFLAIVAMHASNLTQAWRLGLSPYIFVKKIWNIILGFFTLRLVIVWIQSFMLRFPSNQANPTTQTPEFVTKQLELLFDGRLFHPIRAQGLEFPFLYGPINANESALLAVILFTTCIIRLIHQTSFCFQSLIWSFIGILSFLTLIFTQSSTTLILMVLCIPLILIINRRMDVIAIAFFLIAAFALYFDGAVQQNFNKYLGRGSNVIERAADLGGRRYIWQKAWTHIQEKPFLGHGYGTDRFVVGRPLQNIEAYENPNVLDSHNTYISVLVENGVVGLVPLLLALLLLWNSCIRKFRKLKNSLSQEMLLLLFIMSFASLAYISFFNSIIIIYRWLMLVPLLLYALILIKDQHQSH